MNNIKLIAETATHHQGEYDFMLNLTQKICNESAADIVKCHIMLDLDEYFHPDHDGYKNMKDWMFSEDQWRSIINCITGNHKELMLLFNDQKAIDFGMEFKPAYVEIHSVCLNDIKLLKKLKNSIKPEQKLVLAIGGTSIDEVENAINFMNHDKVVLMFGFQNYPTKFNTINFGKMRRIMKLFPSFEFGYADHTAWNNKYNEIVTLMGAAQGMHYIEKHITTHYGEERVDWSAAISFEKFNRISEHLRLLEECIGDSLMRMNAGEEAYSTFGPMKKAGIISKEVKEGEIIDIGQFNFKRTSQMSDLSQVELINAIGKKWAVNLQEGKCINKSHINW